MTLMELMQVIDTDIEVTVFHNDKPINFWYGEDPRKQYKVQKVYPVSEFEMIVEIIKEV